MEVLKQENEHLKAEIASLAFQKEEARRLYQETNSELIDVKNELATAIANYKKLLNEGPTPAPVHTPAPAPEPKRAEPEDETEFQKLQNELEQCKKELKEAKKLISRLSFEKEENRRLFQETNSALIDSTTDLKKLQAESSEDARKAKIASLRSEISELSFEREEFRRKYQETNSALIDAKDEIKSFDNTLKKKTAKLEAELEAKNTEILNLKSGQTQPPSDREEELTKQIEFLKTQLNNEIASKSLQKEEDRRKQQEMNSALIDANDKIRQLESQRAEIPEIQRNAEIADLKAQIAQLMAENRRIRHDNDAIREDAEKLHRQLKGKGGISPVKTGLIAGGIAVAGTVGILSILKKKK